jgi:long-chain fatty acid transport protein
MLFNHIKSNKNIITPLVGLLFASQAWGAGFQIQEQNVTNLGTAYAGTAALAADASTSHYNPAGMTRIKGQQLVLAAALISPDTEFNPSIATNMGGVPLPSRGEEDAGKLAAVPSFHYTAEVNDQVALGLSVTAPFGLATVYSENSVVRYVATRSELKTLDISPSIAYRWNDKLSVAAGVDALWAKAHLDLQTSFPSPAATIFSDGFQRNTADDWGWGYHLAMLYEFSQNTRFGINYRSHVNIDAKGESEQMSSITDVPNVPNTFTNGLRSNFPGGAKVVLPETLYISAYHAFTDQFAVMADVNWTAWSRFRTLRLRYEAPLPGTSDASRQPTDTWERWDDATRIALGMEYTPCDKYKLRFGLAWDESPVSTEYRTARVPDSDRIWVGVGLGFALAKHIWVDLGYAHLFFDDADMVDNGPRLPNSTQTATRVNVSGQYKTNVNIAGMQLRWNFN